MAMRISYFRHHIRISNKNRNISTLNGTFQQAKMRKVAVSEEILPDGKVTNNSDILFHDAGRVGLITLNRPHAMNALNVPMCKLMIKTLNEWEFHKDRVVIEGAGDNAFCSGGDLTLVKSSCLAPDFDLKRRYFFGNLYSLIHLIGTYKTQYIALMNNVTMGNGAGLSLHAKYRIVTDKSVFAMPETSLGYYPDAGSSYVFPRLRGMLGLFLGLTGYKLKGPDIVLSGIASHYVPSESLPELKKELVNSPQRSTDDILKDFQLTNLTSNSGLLSYMDRINDYFSAPSVEEIIARLEADGSDWAKKIVKTMQQMSPTSLKVCHEVYQRGKDLSFSECIKMEYQVSCSFINPTSDFLRGASAVISKDKKPEWDPASLKDVKEEDVAQRFKSVHPDKELKL